MTEKYSGKGGGLTAANAVGRIRVIENVLGPADQEVVTSAWRHAPYIWGETDSGHAQPAGTVLELEITDPVVALVGRRLAALAEGGLSELGLTVTRSSGATVPTQDLAHFVPWRSYVNFFRRGDHPMRHKDNIGFPSITVRKISKHSPSELKLTLFRSNFYILAFSKIPKKDGIYFQCLPLCVGISG